jgi:hypothetical protein
LPTRSLSEHGTLRALENWALIVEMSLLTREEILSTDTAALAHAAEYASLVVEVDRSVKLGNVASIHDKNAVITDDRLEAMGCNILAMFDFE